MIAEPARIAARADDAERIIRAAIAAADPAPAVRRAVLAAPEVQRAGVHVLAIGKAAVAMMDAALDALPHPPLSALAVIPHDPDARIRTPIHSHIANAAAQRTSPGARPMVIRAAHPFPDASSASAAARVEAQLNSTTAEDVVLVLLSGGASSLCTAPVADISIDDYAALVRALMAAGADIADLNAVRGRIDRLKGGGMARLIAPARVIGFIISDVVGDRTDVIGSGPLTPPADHADAAVRVLERYGLWSTAPASVRRVLTGAATDSASEPAAHRPSHASALTPDDDYSHVTTRIILNNRSVLEGAASEAHGLGYDVHMCDDPVTGAARAAGARIAREAGTVAERLRRLDRAACLLYGGETTVVVSGHGRGGRNQELALAAAIALHGTSRITVASAGTDGVDGPTDAAGAICDGRTVQRGRHRGIDAAEALEDNDSYTFFSAAGGLIRTGVTGTNVMDVQVALIDPREMNGGR